jgi:hypothetical protein
MSLAQKLLELQQYLAEHGEVVDHAECEIAGNRDSITSYRVEGRLISISMHNGAVAGVVTR